MSYALSPIEMIERLNGENYALGTVLLGIHQVRNVDGWSLPPLREAIELIERAQSLMTAVTYNSLAPEGYVRSECIYCALNEEHSTHGRYDQAGLLTEA